MLAIKALFLTLKKGSFYLRNAILLCILILSCTSYAGGTFPIDRCENEINKYSYNVEDAVCITGYSNTSVGYMPTYSMEMNSYNGYFNPEITILMGTYIIGTAFSSAYCSYTDTNLLNYHALGGKNNEWVKNSTFNVAIYCLRTEPVVAQPYERSAVNASCLDQAPDKGDFWANPPRGRFGADYPGQQALCVYAQTLFGVFTSCDDLPKNMNRYRVKCLKLPAAPPPPPFCDIIMGSEKVRAVYLKPTDIYVNSFFEPAAKIMTQRSKKTCGNGQIIDPSLKCPDGTDGVINTDQFSQIVAASLSPSMPEPVAQHKEIVLGNSRYHTYLTVKDRTLCISGSYSASGNRENLGCLPRTMPIDPSLTVYGSIGTTPDDDTLFLNVVFDNDVTGSSANLPPTSTSQFIQMMETQNTTGLNNSLKNLYGITMSSARLDFQSTEDNADTITPKKICKGSDGLYGSYPATEKCDVSTKIPVVNAYKCESGAIVSAVGDCGGGTSYPVQAKQCGNNTYVDISTPCDVGFILYEDDPDGGAICLQGMLYEQEEYFILQNDKKKYFYRNPRVLMPVDTSTGQVLYDYSKPVYRLGQLTQADYDTMEYNLLGYYTFNINGHIGKYKIINQEVKASDGTITSYTESTTGAPLFISDSEQEFVLPSDPVKRGLCIKIDLSQMEDYKPFNIMYNHPAMYSSHLLSDAAIKQNSTTLWNAHFETGIPSTEDYQNIQYHPLTSLHDSHYFCLECQTGWNSLTPFPSNYDGKYYAWYTGHGATRGDGNWYNDIHNLMYFYETYFHDPRIAPTGCRQLTFELWGGGAFSRDGNWPAGSPPYTHYAHKEPRKCEKGHNGENGGYIKGAMTLRRNSKIFVLVGHNTHINSNGPSPGTALWIYDDVDNKPYKLIALAKPGNAILPSTTGRGTDLLNLPAEEAMINPIGTEVIEKYRNILNSSIYGVTDYANPDDGIGLYERPGYFIESKDIVKKLAYRNITGNTACGHNRSDYPLKRCGSFGPITIVSGSTEIVPMIPDDLKANVPETDINKVGSWAFFRQHAHAKGDPGWRTVCDDFSQMYFTSNQQSKGCLRYTMKILCGTDYGFAFPGENIANADAGPPEQCPGIGGSYRSSATGSADWAERRWETGNMGLAKISCQ